MLTDGWLVTGWTGPEMIGGAKPNNIYYVEHSVVKSLLTHGRRSGLWVMRDYGVAGV